MDLQTAGGANADLNQHATTPGRKNIPRHGWGLINVSGVETLSLGGGLGMRGARRDTYLSSHRAARTGRPQFANLAQNGGFNFGNVQSLQFQPRQPVDEVNGELSSLSHFHMCATDVFCDYFQIKEES